MNWKLKGHVMAVLSRLPGGRRTYHLLQRLLGTNRINIEKDVSKALEILDMIHIAGQSAEGRVFLESLSIHKDFAGFSPDELAGDYMWAAYQRPEFVTSGDRSPHHASSQDSQFAGAASC